MNTINNTNDREGSVWRKWDLHVHTKDTCKNDQFKSGDFNSFCVTFFKKALENNISAIGVTDYFSIENYKKVIEFVKNIKSIDSNNEFNEKDREKIKNIFILPNVELRVIPSTHTKQLINIHCIFNPSYVSKLNDKFFTSILDSSDSYKMSQDGLIECGKEYQKQNSNNIQVYKDCRLLEIVKKLESDTILDDDDYFKIGVTQFSIDFKSLKKLFKESELQKNTIVIVSNSSNDGLSGLQKKNETNEDFWKLRKSIYQFSQMIFSGNPEDRKYFLGQKSDDENDVKKKCGSLKPCIHGSDAHTEEKLFSPNLDRYCWIKADLTFEGLKQIMYEPEDRVFIGIEPPVLERVKNNKGKYIDSLNIKKKEDSKLQDKWFDDVTLKFSSELTAIIGNKGSGKSAIADTIGVLCNTCNAGEKNKYLSFLKPKRFKKKGLAENFEGTLTWKNTNEIKKKLDEDIDKTEKEKVKYLPQNYFESLTNNLKGEEFENTLKDVIFAHISDEEQLNQKSFKAFEDYKKKPIKDAINKLKQEINNISAEISKLEKEKHPDSLKKYENLLKGKQEELKTHNEIKPKEIEKPNEDNQENKEKINTLDKCNERLEEVNQSIEKAKGEIKKINISIEELDQIIKKIEEFDSSIKEYKESNKTILERYNLSIDEVIKIDFNLHSINKKIEDKKKEKIKIEKTLKDENEIENNNNQEKEETKNNSLIIQKETIEKNINQIKEELSKPEKDYQNYQEKLKKWEAKKKEIEGDTEYPETIKFLEKTINYIKNDLSKELEDKRKEIISKSIEIFNQKKEIINLYNIFKTSVERKISNTEKYNQKLKIKIDVTLKKKDDFFENFFHYINQNKSGTFYSREGGEKYLTQIFEDKELSKKDDIKFILKKIILYLEEDKRDGYSENRQITDQIENTKEFYNFLYSLDYLEESYELKFDNKKLTELSPGEKGAVLLAFYLMIDTEDIPLVIDQPEDNLDNKSIFQILTSFIRFAKKKRQIIIVTHNPNLAIGADAEQIIYVELDKDNQYEFKSQMGSIENPEINKKVVEILEGTQPAFDKRKLKYNF